MSVHKVNTMKRVAELLEEKLGFDVVFKPVFKDAKWRILVQDDTISIVNAGGPVPHFKFSDMIELRTIDMIRRNENGIMYEFDDYAKAVMDSMKLIDYEMPDKAVEFAEAVVDELREDKVYRACYHSPHVYVDGILIYYYDGVRMDLGRIGDDIRIYGPGDEYVMVLPFNAKDALDKTVETLREIVANLK